MESKRIKNTRAMFFKLKKLDFNKISPISETPKKIHEIKGRKNNLSKKTQLFKVPENDEIIFYTGGIGDIFAVDSHMSLEEKSKVHTILYATRKYEPIRELYSIPLNDYQNLSKHVNVWHDFKSFWCFYTKDDCIRKLNGAAPQELLMAKDLSIMGFFSQIANGIKPYTGSSFLKQKVADISKFELPKRYYVICPFSTDKSNRKRDFNANDWSNTFKILKDNKLQGVVLNNGSDLVMRNETLIDFNNKTTLLESIEILKGAEGYLGIDSSLSVLAAQLFSPPRIQIKCSNPHALHNMKMYWAPHQEFKFVNEFISFG